MAYAVEHTDPTTGVTKDHDTLSLRKYSSYVKVPQLFFANKPILQRHSALANSPKVSGTTWCCFCADPTKAIAQHNIDDYTLGGVNGDLRILAGLTNYKKTDKGSGLTVSVKGIRNNSGTVYSQAWSEASLRITRTSISTDYLNVFTWAAFAGACTNVADNFAWWTNDADTVNVQSSGSYPYRESYVFDTSTKVDGITWRIVHQWGTIKKATSGTYLYVAAPWGLIRSSTAPSVTGWGIILEPTNSNPYPV